MKQLKQFIHMIDLLNGLEEDQRQHYQLANEQQKFKDPSQPQSAQHQTSQPKVIQNMTKEQQQALILQEQIESLRSSQSIDINIWRHFQSLLKKNLHNPYLREALMKKAAMMQSYQPSGSAGNGTTDVSLGLRLFLEDLSLQDLTQSFSSFSGYAQQCYNQGDKQKQMIQKQKGGSLSQGKHTSLAQPQVLASGAQNPRALGNLLDKSLPKQQKMIDNNPRQRMLESNQALPRNSSVVQVNQQSSKDELPQQPKNDGSSQPQQILLERYMAGAQQQLQQHENSQQQQQTDKTFTQRLRQTQAALAHGGAQPANAGSIPGMSKQSSGIRKTQMSMMGSTGPNAGPENAKAQLLDSVGGVQFVASNPIGSSPLVSSLQGRYGGNLNNAKPGSFSLQAPAAAANASTTVNVGGPIMISGQKTGTHTSISPGAAVMTSKLGQNSNGFAQNGAQNHANGGQYVSSSGQQPMPDYSQQHPGGLLPGTLLQSSIAPPSAASAGTSIHSMNPGNSMQPQGGNLQAPASHQASHNPYSHPPPGQQLREQPKKEFAQPRHDDNVSAVLGHLHAGPHGTGQQQSPYHNLGVGAQQHTGPQAPLLNQNHALYAGGNGVYGQTIQNSQSYVGGQGNSGHSEQQNTQQTQQQSVPSPQQQATIPSQISSTLFIMDCQTFGIFNNQKLLKIPGNNPANAYNKATSQADWQTQQHMYQMGLGLPGIELTEAQIVNFVMSRAQTSNFVGTHGIIPKELPKLSEDAKRILNTIKAQQHLNMFHEIQKIDTLVIELDYYDYKNQLLQQLFHHYGNRVLSNLVHKIIPTESAAGRGPEEAYGMLDQNAKDKDLLNQQQNGDEPQNQANFQTIHEYIDKIRQHHDETIRLGNLQQQQLFSQINDLSSGNDCDHVFESVDVKSHQNDLNSTVKKDDGNDDGQGAKEINRKIDQFALARSSEALADARKSDGQLDIMGQKQKSSENIDKKELLQNHQETKTNYENDQMQRSSYNQATSNNTSNVALFQKNFNQRPKNKHGEQKPKFRDEDLQQFVEELQHLFPKYRCRKVQDQTHINLDHSFSSDTKKKQVQQSPPQKSPNAVNGADDAASGLKPAEKPKMKKLNFHVIVKDTKLYHALRFIEEYKRAQNSREAKRNDAEGDSKGPMSIYQMSSEMSNRHNLHDLSSFILTKDCSILKFALYCFHVGIVNSVQQMMRQFFKHVFIVIKPGQKTLPDGTILKLKELPQVDVDKISKYLIQTKVRKAMQNQQKQNQKNGGKYSNDGKILSAQDIQKLQQNVNLQNSARRNLYGNNYLYGSGVSAPVSNPKKYTNQRYESKNIEKEMQKNFSLKSFKSVADINQSPEAFLLDYSHHFNSGPSTIKIDGPAATEPCTIKVIHKPYTHLDNSRIQKAFKIYNDFVQLVFKNRLQIVQNADNFQQNELQKGDITKIYKLAAHMNIKLPKRTNSSSLGRQPLVETLKNHRQLSLIKEQMIRFIHRLLNEENGISQNFFNGIILGSAFQTNSSGNQSGINSSSPSKQDAAAANAKDKDGAGAGGAPTAADYSNALSTGGTRLSSLTQNHLVLRQVTTFYKYQVGVGNNHYLIKSLMKQRLWWHHIQRDKQYQQGIIKLDFDEAHIMWTQWRKQRLYYHLAQHSSFQEEFGDLISAIDLGRIHIVLHSSNNQLNQEGLIKIIDKYVRQDKNAEKSARIQQAINMNNSVSPRVALDHKDKEQASTAAKAKYKSKSKSKHINTRNDYDLSESNKDQKSPGLNQAKGPRGKLNAPPANSRQSNSEGQGARESQKIKKRKNQNDSENDADMEDDEYSSDDFGQNTQRKEQKKKSQQQAALTKVLSMSNTELQSQLEKCKKQFQKMYNRLEFNQHLNNKKALFLNMRNYYTYCCENEDVFDTLPLTFHIKAGQNDPEYCKFEEHYKKESYICQQNKNRKNIWIIKPGENSNRGTGIKVEQELGRIRNLVHQYCGANRTMILQKYIDNPLLIQRRKFDIRCFSLVTSVNGVLKAYFYRDGYIRTASKEYNIATPNLNNKFIHLVNDAVQKYSEDYGKYEPGNKLSYCELQKYFTQTSPEKKIHLERDIVMQIKKIVTDTIRATFHVIDSKKRLNSFELFGYDFMFDDNFKPFLIEVNSNPSLEPSSNLLTKLFHQMLDNTFRIAIDPLFPPTDGFSMKKGAIGIEMCPENRYDLIFDERVDGPGLLKQFDQIGKKELEEIQSINDLEGSEDEQENEAEQYDQDGAGPPNEPATEADDPEQIKIDEEEREGFENTEENDDDDAEDDE